MFGVLGLFFRGNLWDDVRATANASASSTNPSQINLEDFIEVGAAAAIYVYKDEGSEKVMQPYFDKGWRIEKSSSDYFKGVNAANLASYCKQFEPLIDNLKSIASRALVQGQEKLSSELRALSDKVGSPNLFADGYSGLFLVHDELKVCMCVNRAMLRDPGNLQNTINDFSTAFAMVANIPHTQFNSAINFGKYCSDFANERGLNLIFDGHSKAGFLSHLQGIVLGHPAIGFDHPVLPSDVTSDSAYSQNLKNLISVQSNSNIVNQCNQNQYGSVYRVDVTGRADFSFSLESHYIKHMFQEIQNGNVLAPGGQYIGSNQITGSDHQLPASNWMGGQPDAPGLPFGQGTYLPRNSGGYQGFNSSLDSFPQNRLNYSGETIPGAPNSPGICGQRINSNILPPKIETPPWISTREGLIGGDGGDTDVIGFIIAATIAVVVDFFRTRSKEKFEAQCKASKKHTEKDCNKVGETFDAYIGRYYTMKATGEACPNLSNDLNILSENKKIGIPQFKALVKNRRDKGHITEDSCGDVHTFYANTAIEINNKWIPASQALQAHLGDNLDQLLGAINGEQNAFVKGELTDIYNEKRVYQMNAMIGSDSFQDANQVLNHSKIALPDLESNYFAGAIQLGLEHFNQALPCLQKAAANPDCTPQMRDFLNKAVQKANEEIEFSNALSNHRNDSLENWKKVINQASQAIKDRLLDYVKNQISDDIIDLVNQYYQLQKDGDLETGISKLEDAEKLIFDSGFKLDSFIENVMSGTVEFYLGKNDKAIELLLNARKDEKYKNDLTVLFILSNAYLDSGKLDEAGTIAEEGQNITKDNVEKKGDENKLKDPNTWTELKARIDKRKEFNNLVKEAKEFIDIEDFDKALACYRRLLEMDPDDVVLKCSVANCLNNLKRHDEAVKFLQDVYDKLEETSDDAWKPKPSKDEETDATESNIAEEPDVEDRYKYSLFKRTETEVKLGNCIYRSFVEPLMRRLTYMDSKTSYLPLFGRGVNAVSAFEPDAIPAVAIRLIRNNMSSLDVNSLIAVVLSKYYKLMNPALSIEYIQNAIEIFANFNSGALQLISEKWKKLTITAKTIATGLRVATFGISLYEVIGSFYKIIHGKKIDIKRTGSATATVVAEIAQIFIDRREKQWKDVGTLPENATYYYNKEFWSMFPQAIKAFCEQGSERSFDQIAALASAAKPFVSSFAGNNRQAALLASENNRIVREKIEQARLSAV